YELLTNWERETEPEQELRHEVERQLALVGAVGCEEQPSAPLLSLSEASRANARGLLADHGIEGDGPWALVHPGATAASRRYPPEAFASAIRALVSVHGWGIVLTGSTAEASLVEQVRLESGVPCVSLAGQLDLEGLAALIEAAPLL